MHKKISVNLSSSFLVRALCQKCHSPPKNYHCLSNPKVFVNPHKGKQTAESVIEYLLFLTEDAKHMKAQDIVVSDLSGITFFKSFNPLLHRTRGNHPNDNVSECLICGCGSTIWWFSNRINKYKPEIANKKCKYNYYKLFNH